MTGTPLAEVAAGARDSSFLSVAQQIAAAVTSGEIRCRIGWEFNGSWFPWASAGVESDYIAAFRRVVGILRGVSDRFVIEWAPNYSTPDSINGGMVNPELSYPGDDVVDVIGMTAYYEGQYDGTNPTVAWNYKRTAPYGFQWQVEFARAHTKRLVLSEWGVDQDGQESYISAVKQWLVVHGYESHVYWDSNSAFQGQLSNGQYPTTGARFIAEFGPIAV
jgi:beta-mannanase